MAVQQRDRRQLASAHTTTSQPEPLRSHSQQQQITAAATQEDLLPSTSPTARGTPHTSSVCPCSGVLLSADASQHAHLARHTTAEQQQATHAAHSSRQAHASMAAAAAGAGAGSQSRQPAPSGAAAATADLPTDASAIRNILRTMGVEAHEPRVVSMLLDFMYSYVSGVLSDAAAFSEQVGRAPGEVENEDVTLAIATRARHSFVPRPPQEGMRQVAEQVNAQRLPDLDASLGYGLRLADEKHLLVQPNWRINVDKQQQQQDAGGTAAGGGGAGAGGGTQLR